MNVLKVVIVDDEQDSVALLQLLLQKHCPQVVVLATFTSSVLALQAIPKLQPDILFLDIEMPELNGFELLEKLQPLQFNVIFVTAYNQFAIKAFRYNALDFLVKPILQKDLIEAVNKANKNTFPIDAQLLQLQKQLKGESIQKIAISTQSGISFINIQDIISVEASGNYSILTMQDKSHFTITKTLKDIQDLLEENNFLRIHRQYIVNLNSVKHFNRNDAILTLENKTELPVAKIQKEKLIEKFKGW
jgi:two-component system, LytTR family, response regulator